MGIPFIFSYRDRFAGKQGFIGQKINGCQNSGICRHPVSLLEDNDIVGHHLPACDPLLNTITNDQGSGAGQVL